MAKTLSLSEVKTRLPELIAGVQDREEEIVVTKNSGGAATYSKIAAARRLGLPVVMLTRPALPSVPSVATVEAAFAWLDHAGTEETARGV